MLEKPDLRDELLTIRLQDDYGVRATQVTFLPLGADLNTAVYRLSAEDGTPYFLKLRRGVFDELTVALPKFLHDRGIAQIIAPIERRTHQLWTCLDAYALILYPFIEGRNGYEVDLSEHQWVEFGAALKHIHTIALPPEIERRLPQGLPAELSRVLRAAPVPRGTRGCRWDEGRGRRPERPLRTGPALRGREPGRADRRRRDLRGRLGPPLAERLPSLGRGDDLLRRKRRVADRPGKEESLRLAGFHSDFAELLNELHDSAAAAAQFDAEQLVWPALVVSPKARNWIRAGQQVTIHPIRPLITHVPRRSLTVAMSPVVASWRRSGPQQFPPVWTGWQEVG